MLYGNNGLLTKAKAAKEQTGIGQEKETIALAYNSALAKKVSSGSSTTVTAGDLNPELTNQGANAEDGDNQIIVTFENGHKYSIDNNGNIGDYTPPEPVTNPHNDENWVYAWLYINGSWDTTPITTSNEEDLQGATIVAKIYEVKNGNEVSKIKPRSFNWQGEDIEFKEDTEYHMVIEGTGEMGELMKTENSNITAAYGWQTQNAMYIMKYLQTHTMPEDKVVMPYVTDVYICEGITNTGKYPFTGGTELKNIHMATTINTLGEGTFMFCNGLDRYVIPNSVTTIGNNAFSYCTGLTSITIPNSVTTIEQDTFQNCTGLTSITIPNSVTTIGNYVFAGCTGLTSITIPNSVTTIGNDAFYGCTGLTSITIKKAKNSIENAPWAAPNMTANDVIWEE